MTNNTHKVAVLMTCFNRKEKTLSCLKQIYSQSGLENVELDVYLVDDGSTDGTGDAVANSYPIVKILDGAGDLYWNGGMNLAWKAAVNEGYDYYMWANDDVSLLPDAFLTMFDSLRVGEKECGSKPVVIGCFSESNNKQHAYGGFIVKKSIWGISTKRIIPTGKITRCDTFNGNLVLIPDEVVKKIGFLDDRYTHAFGDKDYGYRCMEENIAMFITPDYIGECGRNSIEGSWHDPSVSLRVRYKRLISPTGLPPGDYFYSFKKNSNLFAGGIALLKLFARLLVPGIWGRMSRSKQGE